MSTPSNGNSDIKQAAEQVDVQQIEKNLEDNKPTDVPEQLTEDQQVPFIDEEVRTDK